MFNAYYGSAFFALLLTVFFIPQSRAADGFEGSWRHTTNSGDCRIVQAGAYFRITNEHAQVATGYRELVALTWLGKDGNPIIGTLEHGGIHIAWNNGTAWVRRTRGSDFEGDWYLWNNPETRCAIRRHGDVLEIENEDHNISQGLLNLVARDGWPSGVLVGEFRDGNIRWRNGSTWIKIPDSKPETAEVELSVARLICQRTTVGEKTVLGIGEPADELYFLVEGKTPAGHYSYRWPSAEGYVGLMQKQEGHKVGWEGVGGRPQCKPILWNGRLAPGETAQFVIALGEQDDHTITKIANVQSKLAKIVLPALGVSKKEASGLAESWERLFGGSEEEQTIGVFSFQVENDGGSIKTSWSPVNRARLTNGQGTYPGDLPRHRHFIGQQGFVLDGAGAEYNISVDVWSDSPTGRR